ncbi:hypothetical protein ASPNIDRAFT_35856 [Aspergillus niger ATCC 1015]|uniref:Uncharacterized protein n=1 Tax=Aspergillus niger (strain ATCC 1015 / CBS 113.46 / FGSC A1144 / LSHB Ac4 / NCTC 3858a / NRRL 328 / USDA 3528.7) TaxID=380704 RepID=G3XT99_ASPNA|nr:hypothetical protein ASPNIDRAFT_35856 [Aspergillus niger ATCC 1015]
MGFHCASARDARDHTPEKLHQKIWMGVLNNDRISEDMIALTLLGAMFSKVVTWLLSGSSNTLLADIIETLYDQNLESGQSLDVQAIINKHELLHFRLEQWADSLPDRIALLPSEELLKLSALPDTRWAVRTLLCIQYHRLKLIMNFPLMMKFLESDSMKPTGEHIREYIQRIRSQILQDDWFAIQELRCLISHISTLQGFMDLYASWYTCNYTNNDPQEGTSNPLDTLATDFVFQHIKLPTEEFLNQCSRHEESEQAQLFLDIFSSIPICE